MCAVTTGQGKVDALHGWANAPLFVLSCPGPLRRHPAVLQRLSAEAFTQCLLGYEAQLLGFAASVPELARRTLFCAAPEILDQPASHEALWRFAGRAPAPMRRGVPRLLARSRSVRVIRGARNAAVIAEDHRAPARAASLHPFAS